MIFNRDRFWILRKRKEFKVIKIHDNKYYVIWDDQKLRSFLEDCPHQCCTRSEAIEFIKELLYKNSDIYMTASNRYSNRKQKYITNKLLKENKQVYP